MSKHIITNLLTNTILKQNTMSKMHQKLLFEFYNHDVTFFLFLFLSMYTCLLYTLYIEIS